MKKVKDLFGSRNFFKRLTILVGILASLFSLYVSRVVKRELNLDFNEKIQAFGYGLENHTVTTSDGYFLTHHRILPKNRNTTNRQVVILAHGMMGKSFQWICMGPNNSLAYNLLDEGFDTWLLNLRGNSFSDFHENISSISDYWQHTWDDIGNYDLTASIDYILQTTGQKSLHYVGYSMGATIFFVLLSEKTEYAMKIKKMVALGPAVYDVNVLISYPSVYYLNKILTELSELTNIRPKKFNGYTCNNGWDVFCALLMKNRFETYDPNINQEKLDELMHFSMGTGSTLLISQFYQNFKAGRFAKFNFGRKVNLEVYGCESPPEYNLSAVQVPIAIFYSKDDKTCSSQGIERLSRELPNAEMKQEISITGFSHGSFFMSSIAKKLINDKIITYLGTEAYH